MKNLHVSAKLVCLCMAVIICSFALATTAMAEKKEIIVYLAASMTKPAKALVDKFNAEHADMEIMLNIGSSGELLNKIQTSGMGDIFIPASDNFLQQAIEKDFIAESKPFLRQWPVFCIAPSGAESIKSFDDLAKPGLTIAAGNPKTTALGQTWAVIETRLPKAQAQAIRANMTVEAAQANQIVQYIKTDAVNAGLLFDSIAKANELTFVEIPAEINMPETAHIATLKVSKQSPADLAMIIQYFTDNIAIFEKAGYSAVK